MTMIPFIDIPFIKKSLCTLILGYMGVLVVVLLGATKCEAQVKQEWEIVELVSIQGVSLKKWNTKSYTTIVDSILVISCKDNKILGLLSHPQQGFFDESDYRVYSKLGESTILSDSVGTLYRQEYKSPFYGNVLVILTDDANTFLMVHPNSQVGIVFHNKKK